jgi:hypothetical protein
MSLNDDLCDVGDPIPSPLLEATPIFLKDFACRCNLIVEEDLA